MVETLSSRKSEYLKIIKDLKNEDQTTALCVLRELDDATLDSRRNAERVKTLLFGEIECSVDEVLDLCIWLADLRSGDEWGEIFF